MVVRVEARWEQDMPMVGSMQVLPIGSGWLVAVDDDGIYTVDSQAGVRGAKVSQDDADAGGLLLRPAGDTAALWLPHNSPEMAKLASELLATDVG